MSKKFLEYAQLETYSKHIKEYIDSNDKLVEVRAESNHTQLKDELTLVITDKIAEKDTQINNLSTTLANDKLELIDLINNKIETELSTRLSEHEVIDTKITDLSTTINIKIENDVSVERDERIESIQNLLNSITSYTKLDDETLTRDSSGNISFSSKYKNIIDDLSYNKPAITSFNLRNGVTTSYPIGLNVTISGLEHKESNIDNIEGTLTLRKGSIDGEILVSNIKPSESIEVISYTGTITDDTTLYLVMTTTKNETIYKTILIDFYSPAKIVEDSNESLSDSYKDIVISNSEVFEGVKNVKITSNIYMYFLSVNEIKKVIDEDSGFNISILKLNDKSIEFKNGKSTNYKVYRTLNMLVPETYNLTIVS